MVFQEYPVIIQHCGSTVLLDSLLEVLSLQREIISLFLREKGGWEIDLKQLHRVVTKRCQSRLEVTLMACQMFSIQALKDEDSFSFGTRVAKNAETQHAEESI